jgi:hypothetical protein
VATEQITHQTHKSIQTKIKHLPVLYTNMSCAFKLSMSPRSSPTNGHQVVSSIDGTPPALA